jgi:hypothetical protein
MTRPPARVGAAALATALALGAAALLPALAIAVVWPLLLVIPGWVLVAWLAPRIDGAGRLGLAIVISVAVSTHLVWWLSLLVGEYGRGTVFAVAAVMGLSVPIGIWRGDAPWRWVTRAPSLAPLSLAVAAAGLVGAALAIGMWRATPDGVISGGSNWSDLAVHLSIAQSVNAGGNFPPDVPYFAGEPLVYHWFADFHAAILAEAAGIFAVPAMVVQSSVLSASLGLLVFSLARWLLRGRDARRVALLAGTLAVFGGGLGFIRLIGDMTVGPTAANAPIGAGNLVELLANHSYDNQWLTGWPYFRIPSVMGTGLLAHRATTAGLPILVGAVLLLVAGLPSAEQQARGWRDRLPLIGLAGLLGALLAPFHFFFFPVLPLLALAWVIAGSRLLDRAAPRNAAAFLLPYLLAVPFALAPALQATGSGSVKFVPGWQAAPFGEGTDAAAFFYLTNLGVPFALALVALLAPGLPRRAFLAAWVIGLFAIPNLVQLSVIDFDMNKYFQAMWIAVALLASWLARRWPAWAVAVVLLLSVPSPLLVAGWTATSRLQSLSAAELAAADWASAETPPGSVFVTDGWVTSLTDPAGRLRLTSFGPYIANLGYNPDDRIADVHRIYCDGDPALAAELMRRYGATYVVDAARPAACTAFTDFAISPSFELAYANDSLRIWRLADSLP